VKETSSNIRVEILDEYVRIAQFSQWTPSTGHESGRNWWRY